MRTVLCGNAHIPISNTWKKIGISLSGGADSALLAYLICKNTKADLHIVTQIRCWKTRPWQEYISEQVYLWLVNKFPRLKFTRHTNFIPPDLEWGRKGPNITDEYGNLKSGNQIILRSYNEYIGHKENFDAWFAAVNKNPDVNLKGALKDRDEGNLPEIFEHMGVTVCHPFINIKKDWIIQQYYNYKIQDLLEITRSCEGDRHDYPDIFGNLDYTTYTPGQYVPECGQCFWCKEREWAINRVEK